MGICCIGIQDGTSAYVGKVCFIIIAWDYVRFSWRCICQNYECNALRKRNGES